MLPFFEWCEATRLGTVIRESTWLFPSIEATHLLGLAMIGGAVLLVDLRLLGWGLRRQPVAILARHAHPWLVGSYAVMIVTGLLLFLSEATKCYFNAAFWVKIVSLVLATLYTFTIRERIVTADDARVSAGQMRLAAIVSVILWSGVGIGGRAIGFY